MFYVNINCYFYELEVIIHSIYKHGTSPISSGSQMTNGYTARTVLEAEEAFQSLNGWVHSAIGAVKPLNREGSPKISRLGEKGMFWPVIFSTVTCVADLKKLFIHLFYNGDMTADRNGARCESPVSLHFPRRFHAQGQTALQSESRVQSETI